MMQRSAFDEGPDLTALMFAPKPKPEEKPKPKPTPAVVVLVLALLAGLPAFAGIEDGPDPFGATTKTVTDDATPFEKGIEDGPDPFVHVFGSIARGDCPVTGEFNVVESEGVNPAEDRELMDDLATCRVNRIEYTYVTRQSKAAAIEATIDQVLRQRYKKVSPCNDLVKCAEKVKAACLENGKTPPKFVMLKPYSKPGYMNQMCTGTCGDNETVVNVTCRIAVGPGEV